VCFGKLGNVFLFLKLVMYMNREYVDITTCNAQKDKIELKK